MEREDQLPLLRTFIQDYNNGWVPTDVDRVRGASIPVYVIGYEYDRSGERESLALHVSILKSKWRPPGSSKKVRALNVTVIDYTIGLEQFLNQIRIFAKQNDLHLYMRLPGIQRRQSLLSRTLRLAGWSHIDSAPPLDEDMAAAGLTVHDEELVLAPGAGVDLPIFDDTRMHMAPRMHVALRWTVKPKELPSIWSELYPGLTEAFNNMARASDRMLSRGVHEYFLDPSQGLRMQIGLRKLECPFTARMEYALVCYVIHLDAISRGRGIGTSIINHLELIAKWVGVHLVIDTVVNPRLYNHLAKRGFLDEDPSTLPYTQVEKLPPIDTPMKRMSFLGHMWRLVDPEEAYVEP